MKNNYSIYRQQPTTVQFARRVGTTVPSLFYFPLLFFSSPFWFFEREEQHNGKARVYYIISGLVSLSLPTDGEKDSCTFSQSIIPGLRFLSTRQSRECPFTSVSGPGGPEGGDAELETAVVQRHLALFRLLFQI